MIRRQRARRRLRVRRLTALAVVVLLVPVFYSYVSTMLQPSSLPLGIRSVEWLRGHGAAWLVNDVERFYYTWRAPKPGGPALKSLPKVGGTASPEGVAVPGARLSVDYRPASIVPIVHPTLPGEGVWRATGQRIHGLAPVLVTTFRSDPTYPRVVAYVAWIDHRLTQLALYPGRYEPPAKQARGPMQVPSSQRWRLLATFNSGFTYGDGHGGFVVNGTMYTPLVRGMGTIVQYASGRVDIVSWNGPASPGKRVVAARQNLPLIVVGGKPNPALNDSAQWGATLGNAIRVWRSGVGIDRHGNLIYAAADYQTAPSLAQILIHAGAIRAMELDINAEWPSFIAYAHIGGKQPTKIVPNGQQSAYRYLVPDDRDFFAIYRRVSGPWAVPFS